MTRQKFEELEQNEGFDSAMEKLWEESDCITDYETLKGFVIKNIENDNNMLALHVLEAIYNSEGDSDFYYYDYTAGTTCTPQCLNNVEDVEQYIGFDKE